MAKSTINEPLETLEVKKENKIEIKSMTRGQMKELRKAGLEFYQIEKADGTIAPDKLDALIDWILMNVYPEMNTDILSNPEAEKIAIETYRKSRGREENLKN